MDLALQNAKSICPDFNISDLILLYYNQTKFHNPTIEVPEFECYRQQVSKTLLLETEWFYKIELIALCSGLPSALLSLMIFCRKEFDTVSFFYHRVINVLELINMIFILTSVLSHYAKDQLSESWLWAQYETYIDNGKFDYALDLAINIIVLWVAIERALLCNSASIFSWIDRKIVAWFVIFTSFFASVVLYLPNWFIATYSYNNATGAYIYTPTDFGSGLKGDLLLYLKIIGFIPLAQLAALVPATCVTIFGLWQISKRKKRLISSSGVESQSSKNLLRQIAVNRQLCVLQVCEAAPILAQNAFSVYRLVKVIPSTYQHYELLQMTYLEARNVTRYKEIVGHLAVCEAIADAIAHCTHFYRYLLFSEKFRKVAKLFFARKHPVASITSPVPAPAAADRQFR